MSHKSTTPMNPAVSTWLMLMYVYHRPRMADHDRSSSSQGNDQFLCSSEKSIFARTQEKWVNPVSWWSFWTNVLNLLRHKQNFTCIFLNENFWIQNRIALRYVLWVVVYVNIGSGHGLVPNKRQTIAWTNDDLVRRHIYVPLGLTGSTRTYNSLSKSKNSKSKKTLFQVGAVKQIKLRPSDAYTSRQTNNHSFR